MGVLLSFRHRWIMVNGNPGADERLGRGGTGGRGGLCWRDDECVDINLKPDQMKLGCGLRGLFCTSSDDPRKGGLWVQNKQKWPLSYIPAGRAR